MERLSLDDFKMKSNNTQKLENLTGGILGACHCGGHDADGSGLIDTFSEYIDYYRCVFTTDEPVVH